MRARLICSLLAMGALFGVTVFSTSAEASPGVCKCNSGCHANAGQCVQGNGCNIGYAPTCGYRGGDAGGTSMCPKTTYISCNGVCDCVPIPGFCETVGGAEYCDAGPPDASPDGTTGDTSVTDTGTPSDTGVKVDTGTPDDAKVDSGTPSDSAVTDAPTVDGCVPFACPSGTKTVSVPGICDPYCAPPCGMGEFKCSPGLSCASDGFCYPGSVADGGFASCVMPGAPPCGACRECDLTTGSCYDDPSCSDGGTVEDGAVSDGDVSDGAATDDASTGDDAGDDTQPAADGADTGGCGCSVPGQASGSGTTALLAGGAALMIAMRRRRR